MPQRDDLTLADVLAEGFEDYVKSYGPLPAEQYAIAHAIMNCRTPALGGHIYRCAECGHEVTLYNSCRNRHCPSCQAFARAEWVQRRMEEVLPVPYFHVVFTLPEQLRDLALRNRAVIYKLLFRAVAHTLQTLGSDPERLGGTIGFIAVLHTWTQTLTFHPHLHCVVPAGALSHDKRSWIACRDGFLFPVAVMRRLFRGTFMDLLKEALKAREVQFAGALAMYENPAVLDQLINDLYQMEWVVYAKRPFATPDAVIKYLGAYTHRVAISNRRIVKIEHGEVTFSYKDRREHGRTKRMTLRMVEFIRRFMTHALPEHFMRIRHYGFFGNRCRGELLPVCMKILGKDPVALVERTDQRWYEIIEKLTGADPLVCPCCGKGRLEWFAEIAPSRLIRVAA